VPDLEERLEAAGVSAGLVDGLCSYGRMVLESNRSFNLTGAKTEDDLAEHIIDSLTLVPYVHGEIVDVGSGAGFPAIPLALATGAPVTLIESTRKKTKFLERVLDTFQLQGAVVTERAEIAGHLETLRDRFQTGTARAVGPGPTVLELVLPFVAPGGAAVLQRGKLDERERAAMSDAALVLGAEVESEIPLSGDRRIIVVRKRKATPNRFPRRPGMPAQRPLCLD
jgi:16S rRNA (guanine527-N7)-methyltransferase